MLKENWQRTAKLFIQTMSFTPEMMVKKLFSINNIGIFVNLVFFFKLNNNIYDTLITVWNKRKHQLLSRCILR